MNRDTEDGNNFLELIRESKVKSPRKSSAFYRQLKIKFAHEFSLRKVEKI